MGIQIINLPPFRTDLKGAVEKFFDIVQSYYKKVLATKGCIFEDFQERGGKDYRKNACLTIKEFEKVVILSIIKYNTKRIIDLPYELVGKVEPFANKVWNFYKSKDEYKLIKVDGELLFLTLLPRTNGTFKRDGLIVNKLRYKNKDYKGSYLAGCNCCVAYDPNNVSKVWLVKDGNFVPFEIIEKFFVDMDLDSSLKVMKEKNLVEREAEEIELQGSIDLTKSIESIVRTLEPFNVDIKNVRITREKEIKKEVIKNDKY